MIAYLYFYTHVPSHSRYYIYTHPYTVVTISIHTLTQLLLYMYITYSHMAVTMYIFTLKFFTKYFLRFFCLSSSSRFLSFSFFSRSFSWRIRCFSCSFSWRIRSFSNSFSLFFCSLSSALDNLHKSKQQSSESQGFYITTPIPSSSR